MSDDSGNTESQDTSGYDMSLSGLEAPGEGHGTSPSGDGGNAGGLDMADNMAAPQGYAGYQETIGRSFSDDPFGYMGDKISDKFSRAVDNFPGALADLAISSIPGVGPAYSVWGAFGGPTVGDAMNSPPGGNVGGLDMGNNTLDSPGVTDMGGTPGEGGGRQDPFLPRGMTTPTMIPQTQAATHPVSAILGPSAMVKGFQGWDPYAGVYNPRMWGPQ